MNIDIYNKKINKYKISSYIDLYRIFILNSKCYFTK